MKKINPKSTATIVVIVITQIGFVLSEYLASTIGNSNVVFSTSTILVLSISKTVFLIGGLVWIIWLLKHKYNDSYTWRDVFPLIMAILLLEYWYFVTRLFSFVS